VYTRASIYCVRWRATNFLFKMRIIWFHNADGYERRKNKDRKVRWIDELSLNITYMHAWLIHYIHACLTDTLHTCMLDWYITYMPAWLIHYIHACSTDTLHTCMLDWYITYMHARLIHYIHAYSTDTLHTCMLEWVFQKRMLCSLTAAVNPYKNSVFIEHVSLLLVEYFNVQSGQFLFFV
jgi:hypothetical protein